MPKGKTSVAFLLIAKCCFVCSWSCPPPQLSLLLLLHNTSIAALLETTLECKDEHTREDGFCTLLIELLNRRKVRSHQPHSDDLPLQWKQLLGPQTVGCS